MTALFVANVKLVLLFALVGWTIALSHAGQHRAARVLTRRPRRTASLRVRS